MGSNKIPSYKAEETPVVMSFKLGSYFSRLIVIDPTFLNLLFTPDIIATLYNPRV